MSGIHWPTVAVAVLLVLLLICFFVDHGLNT